MPHNLRPFKLVSPTMNGFTTSGTTSETFSTAKPSAQGKTSLANLLQKLSTTDAETRRPFLINLNGDNSFLISIPRPRASITDSGKAFFHIVTDPWLWGPATTIDPQILALTHIEPEAYKSLGAVEVLIRAIENAASKATESDGPGGSSTSPISGTVIDALLVTIQFTDHAHPATLMEADPSIPVIASPDAIPIIQGFNHFKTIVPVRDFVTAALPLPPFLAMMRIPPPNTDDLVGGFNSGILITIFPISSTTTEAILYSPHGVSPETVARILPSPITKVIALLHPLNETHTDGFPGGIGADNGLALYRLTGAQFWTPAHDPDMNRSGLLAEKMDFVVITLEEALRREEAEQGHPSPRPNFAPRGNGTAYLLE